MRLVERDGRVDVYVREFCVNQSAVLGALGDPTGSTSRIQQSRGLLNKEEWGVLDKMEMRLAILPAVKTLLGYHDNSGKCDNGCAIFKGMDIGRGNPNEFQVICCSLFRIFSSFAVCTADIIQCVVGSSDLSSRLLLGVHRTHTRLSRFRVQPGVIRMLLQATGSIVFTANDSRVAAVGRGNGMLWTTVDGRLARQRSRSLVRTRHQELLALGVVSELPGGIDAL